MPHLESKTKLIMTASVNKYINPFFIGRFAIGYWMLAHSAVDADDLT